MPGRHTAHATHAARGHSLRSSVTELLDEAMTSSMRRIMTAASAAEEIAWVLTRSGSTTPAAFMSTALPSNTLRPMGLLALFVGCTDLDEHVDGVETCILCKGARDDLECRCKCLDGELGPATNGCCILAETERELGLDCTATGNDLLVLDNDTDNAECIVDCTLEFIDYVLGAALDDDGDRLGVLALLDKGHLFAADLALLDKAGLSEFFLADRVDGGDEGAPVARASFSMSLFLTRRAAKIPALAR